MGVFFFFFAAAATARKADESLRFLRIARLHSKDASYAALKPRKTNRKSVRVKNQTEEGRRSAWISCIFSSCIR